MSDSADGLVSDGEILRIDVALCNDPMFLNEHDEVKALLYKGRKYCLAQQALDHQHQGPSLEEVVTLVDDLGLCPIDSPPIENKKYNYLGCYILQWGKGGKPTIGVQMDREAVVTAFKDLFAKHSRKGEGE